MLKTNYHSHCDYCDGKSSMEEMVISAIEHGFSQWGVSSHAPVPFENHFAIKQENVKSYLAEFQRLKEKYSSCIDLFLGMELDFITDMMEDIDKQAKAYGLDYYIGSVHQVKEHNPSMDSWFIDGHDPEVYDRELKELFAGDIRRGCEAFFLQQKRMLDICNPPIIGHLDKITMHNKGRYFTNATPWYGEMLCDLLQTAKKHDTIVEVNTRGLYKKRHNDFYPGQPWLKYVKELGLRVTISTDCHKSDEVDLYYDEALEMLKSLGFKTLSYFSAKTKTFEEQKIL